MIRHISRSFNHTACVVWLRVCGSLLLALGASAPVAAQQPQPSRLQEALAKEDPAALAKDAREQGDVHRGALVYYRQDLACSRCHSPAAGAVRVGPELGKVGKDATDAYIVESVLLPSKVIKKGFETILIETDDGRKLSGVLVKEDRDSITIASLGVEGTATTVAKKNITDRSTSAVSLMPDGQINVLSSRQEFLDLARYLFEVVDKGPDAERQLRPASALLAPPPLPAYERDLDHAGLIRAWDNKSLKRGEALYNRVCMNCHGTREQVGSMPTSLRFAEGKFKNGADPLHMYQTLTHGFGMMTPQYWMVPEQKYDVIHYIRETYLKPFNPSQFVKVDEAYLAALPKGSTRGPKPSNIEQWVLMNYGPSLMATIEVGNKGNFAYKGIAARLDDGSGGISRGKQWMLFDHDTFRMVAGWRGEGFIDWHGINFNGQHQSHPRVAGEILFENGVGPGWANPSTGSFDDPRLLGRDGKHYGPLPRDWARFNGVYHFGNQVIISYSIGDAAILEMPGHVIVDQPPDSSHQKSAPSIYSRTFNIGKSAHDLVLRAAREGVAVATTSKQTSVETTGGNVLVKIPAAATPMAFQVLLSDLPTDKLEEIAGTMPPAVNLKSFTKGGPRRWPEAIKTPGLLGDNSGPYTIDVLSLPNSNPWNCQVRLTGFDFFRDGRRAAVCTWDGDVWLVEGVDTPENGLTWRRIASGLFQPLGLKIVDDQIYLTCRDQIVILRDLNGDGETDFYECFNNDQQVTDHFHEFAMGLQTDSDGNFYYAKAARHGLPGVVPQHGTLLRVSKDGSRTDILATGFRAPNGVCVNPDGTFFLTDQEGFWVPKNRIDRVEVGGYYGNFWGYTDVTNSSDDAMKKPLVWITNAFDRSPSEELWVTSDKWGPLKGSLLNFSYGYGKVYVVPYETVNGQVQGGMSEFPMPQFPTGVMRGRFHAQNGQLYCCGMFAWAGNQTAPGGFYRVRYTGKPVYLPTGLTASKKGVAITFSGALDPAVAAKPGSYAVSTWSLKRSADYGSEHYNTKTHAVTKAAVSADGKTVLLEIEDLQPTWCMEIKYDLKAADGTPIKSFLHNTIHALPE